MGPHLKLRSCRRGLLAIRYVRKVHIGIRFENRYENLDYTDASTHGTENKRMPRRPQRAYMCAHRSASYTEEAPASALNLKRVCGTSYSGQCIIQNHHQRCPSRQPRTLRQRQAHSRLQPCVALACLLLAMLGLHLLQLLLLRHLVTLPAYDEQSLRQRSTLRLLGAALRTRQ